MLILILFSLVILLFIPDLVIASSNIEELLICYDGLTGISNCADENNDASAGDYIPSIGGAFPFP